MNTTDTDTNHNVTPPKPGDIQRSTYEYGAEPYRDPRVLHVLYHEWELSQRQIAQHCGLSLSCIQKWFARLNIDTRPQTVNQG